MMTVNDKKLFNEIYHSSKYLGKLTSVDYIRSARYCEKLFDYIQSEGVDIAGDLNVKQYMHLAYWLGVIDAEKWKGKLKNE